MQIYLLINYLINSNSLMLNVTINILNIFYKINKILKQSIIIELLLIKEVDYWID